MYTGGFAGGVSHKYDKIIRCNMARTSLRIPDDLISEIKEDLDEEESKSEWFREAARERLNSSSTEDRIADLEDRVDKIESNLLIRLF